MHRFFVSPPRAQFHLSFVVGLGRTCGFVRFTSDGQLAHLRTKQDNVLFALS
jgi:hypothetical protein